jgi:uncharacterized protein (DUF1499 family)
MTNNKKPRGTRWCLIGSWLAGIGAALVAAGLVGVQIGILPPIRAFMAYGVGAVLFLVCIIVLVVGLLLSKGSGGDVSAARSWGSLLLGLAVITASLMLILGTASSGAPPIHDISTDLGNPPFFEAVLPMRADAPNPPEYPGNETAEQQRAAYPDLDTLAVENSSDEVFAAAERVAREMGWEIVATDPSRGRIEATDTTSWFRFKDDVVIRLTARGYGTYVDVRSKSRVGMGDMGVNASRIREFLERLSADLET